MTLRLLFRCSVLLAAFALLPRIANAIDTDGDGLLDLIDVPGFDPNATGELDYNDHGIEDLDGARLLTSLQRLQLYNNHVTSLENRAKKDSHYFTLND